MQAQHACANRRRIPNRNVVELLHQNRGQRGLQLRVQAQCEHQYLSGGFEFQRYDWDQLLFQLRQAKRRALYELKVPNL